MTTPHLIVQGVLINAYENTEYKLYHGQLAHQTSRQSSTRGISSADECEKPTMCLLHLSTFCGGDSSISGIRSTSRKLMSCVTLCHSVLQRVSERVAGTQDFDCCTVYIGFVNTFRVFHEIGLLVFALVFTLSLMAHFFCHSVYVAETLAQWLFLKALFR